MIKRVYYIFILIFTVYSCDNFVVKKDNQEEVLKEKWGEIDKNQVDKPPSFDACIDEPEESDICFQNIITKHIKTYLANHIISVKESINDTIWVPLLITKDKEIILEDFVVPEIIASQVDNFESILAESIKSLPSIKPAIVRSATVTTRYKLPIVIHVN
ncbi:hypothetical protein [uncultured Aquimarina sp.]|uniref:hypothetical protein n=1 Tax=uncultured Aquimarina sp. TaxID=575652 RepID=UPI002638F5B3|nr:hypothetical protein [uncultured Aquimarina sp.]